MIDPEALNGLDKDHRELAVGGLKALAASGIIRQQLLMERESILQGNSDEAPEKLAEQILAYRKRTQFLETFAEFIESIERE